MPAPTPEEEIENLRDEIADLRRQLTEAAASSDNLNELRRQLADARRELDALRAAPPVTKRSIRRVEGFFEVEEPE